MSATEALNFLESRITSKEFDEGVAKNKLLHECKTKGFKHLAKLGRHHGGIDHSEQPEAANFSPLEFAQLTAQMVNNGESMNKAAAKFGRGASEVRYYCEKFGIDIIPRRERRFWDVDETYKRVHRLINARGNNLKDAAAKMDCSTNLIRGVLRKKNRQYNAITKKIERIKKS